MNLTKSLARTLLLAILFGCPLLLAQPGSIVQPDSLEFYRWQALMAATPEARFRLNHIGVFGRHTDAGFLVSAVLEDYPADRAGVMRGDVIVSSAGADSQQIIDSISSSISYSVSDSVSNANTDSNIESNVNSDIDSNVDSDAGSNSVSSSQPTPVTAFHPVFSFNERSGAPDNFTAKPQPYRLEIDRAGDSLTVTVTPVFENLVDSLGSASINSIQQFSAGNKLIGYVHLWVLSRNTNDLISYQQLLGSLSHCDGIILDLRDSSGFLDRNQLELFQAIEPRLLISNAPAGLAHWQQGSLALDFEAFRKPIAVLINGRTLGAAELLAYELAKAERVVTVGTQTPGKLGSLRMLDGQRLQYTASPETRVDGAAFENSGVAAEREVRYPPRESRRDDPQFNEAISLLLGII